MTLPSRLRAAWRNLVRRERVERELDDELRAYVEMLAAEKVSRGMTPDDARRAALVEAGGVEQTKDAVRDARAGAWIESVARDLRHTRRALSRTPGFTLAVVATFAIGIGLNAAIFTLAYGVLARPLPARDAGRLVNVYQGFHSAGKRGRDVRGSTSLLSFDEYAQYAEAPAFVSSAAFQPVGLTVADPEHRIVGSELVTCRYFRTLEVATALGRAFTDDECAHVGGGAVVVLSYATWRAKYGADSTVVGRLIHVNGLPLTVVGVAAPGFDGVSFKRAAMWVPLTMQPALDHGRDSVLVHKNVSWLTMVARLAPGASLSQAAAQAAVTARRLDAAEPGRVSRAFVVRGAYLNFPDVASEGGIPIALTALLGLTIVGIAGANVMNLLLARGLARRREFAIRLAMGASRRQLVRQLLVESGALAISGAAVGMSFVLALPPLVRSVAPADVQLDVAPDLRIVVYVFLVAMVATMLVGLTPALQTTRVDLATAFHGAARLGRRHVRPSRLRSVIVGVQVAGSAMLLVLAGLFLRGALRATTVQPGYATHNIVAFTTNASALGYDTPRAAILYRELIDRVRNTPGVVDVAIASRLPLLARSSGTIRIDRGRDSVSINTDNAIVTGSYFHTMDIRIVRGAAFDSIDASAEERPVVISAALAARLWPGEEPLGKRLKSRDRWFRVVGIASDVAASSLSRPRELVAYYPATSALDRAIVARTSGSTAALIAAVPLWAHALDPALIVESERFEDRVGLVLLPAKFAAAATATLGILALVLATVGIAGVVGFAVGQRRSEIAVRLAVGATPHQVVGLMMREARGPILSGMAGGLVIAMAIAEVVRELLFGVSPLDPAAYLGIVGVLAASAVIATYVPSRRAAAIDPAWTLRDDGSN